MTAINNHCPIQLTSHCAIAPTFPLVKVFSEIFASLCDSSDKRFADHPSAMKMHLSVVGAHFFEAGEVPGISIAQYVDRIHTYSQCPPECFIVSLIFIDRLIAIHKGFAIHSRNFHRLFLTSTMMSTKFFEDTYYNNAFWAKVGGVALAELNHMEVQFLRMIDFQMSIPLELYDQYFAELVYFAEREKIILPEEAVEFRSVPLPIPPPFEHGVPPVAYSAVAAVHPVHQVASQFKSPILRALPETKYPSVPSLAPAAAAAVSATTSAAPSTRRGRRRPRRRGRRAPRVVIDAPESQPISELGSASQGTTAVCSALSSAVTSPLHSQDLRATPTHSDRSVSPSTFQSHLDSARQSPSDLQVLSNMGLQSPIKDEDDPMPTPSVRMDKRSGIAFCKEDTTPTFSYSAGSLSEKHDLEFVPIPAGPGANMTSSHLAEVPTAGARYLEDDSKPTDAPLNPFQGCDPFTFPAQYFGGSHGAPPVFTAERPSHSSGYQFAYHSASLPVPIPGALVHPNPMPTCASSSSAPLPTSLKFSPPEASCNMQARFQPSFPLSGPLFRFSSESGQDHEVSSAFGSPPSDDSPVANISLY